MAAVAEMTDKLEAALEEAGVEITIDGDDGFSIKTIKTDDETIKKILDDPELSTEEALELVQKYNRSREEQKNIKFIQTDRHYIQNSKLSNELTKDFLNQGDINIAVANIDKHNEVCITSSLTYDGDDLSISGSSEFTSYDKIIHDAVCSLWAVGNNVITPAQIYRNITGLNHKDQINKETLVKVFNSIQKSRFMEVKIDCTEQAKLYPGLDKIKISENMLYSKLITIETGGHEIEAFQILRPPILYEYNKHLKQIISINTSLLNTNKGGKCINTEENTALKMYLIKRIEVMKNSKKTTNKIKYETIFSNADIEITAKDTVKKKRTREKIRNMLESWKDEGYITDFKEYKAGRNFEGVELQYKPELKQKAK